MISERDLGELPSDPLEAFAKVESLARDRLEYLLTVDKNSQLARAQYMNAVITSTKSLNLNMLAEYSALVRTDQLIERFDDFMLEVDRHVLTSRISKSQRNTQFSVALDASTRLKIHHYIGQIRATVDTIEIPQNKKEIIFKKISDLALEIDRTRTRLEIVADVIITMANTAEEVGRKLNPIRKMIDSITALLGKA